MADTEKPQSPTTEIIGDRTISGPHPEGGNDPFDFWIVTSADGRTLIGRCYSLEAARELAAAPTLYAATDRLVMAVMPGRVIGSMEHFNQIKAEQDAAFEQAVVALLAAKRK